jgi:hypothetical protein
MIALVKAFVPEIIAGLSLALFAACILTWAAVLGGLPS